MHTSFKYLGISVAILALLSLNISPILASSPENFTNSSQDKFALWKKPSFFRGEVVYPYEPYDDNDKNRIYTTKETFERLKARGANVVSLNYPGPLKTFWPYSFNSRAMEYLDDAIEWAEEVGLYVIIHLRNGPAQHDSHHEEEDDTDEDDNNGENDNLWNSEKAQRKWVRMWKFLAKRYNDEDHVIGYNLMVAPDPEDPEDWNALAARITKAIRKKDPYTPILVSTPASGRPRGLKQLKLTGDARTIYSFQMEDDNDALSDAHDFEKTKKVIVNVENFGCNKRAAFCESYFKNLKGTFEKNGWSYTSYLWDEETKQSDPWQRTTADLSKAIPGYPITPIGEAFTEEFNGNTINEKLFEIIDGYQYHASWYTAAQTSIGNGVVKLASDVKNRYKRFTRVGGIKSQAFYSYGKLTVRAKANPAVGAVSAVFFYNEDKDENEGGHHEEIDIELSSKLQCVVEIATYHDDDWTNENKQNEQHRGGLTNVCNIKGLENFDSKKFNTYVIDWQPKKLTWYINDIKVAEYIDAIPTTPMHISLDTYNSTDWGNFVETKPSGAGALEIDFVSYSPYSKL